MAVAVMMKGLLEPVVIEGDFLDATNQLQVAAARGMEFIVTTTPDGDNVALATRNILTFREVDETIGAF
jgi:hypothetical protein